MSEEKIWFKSEEHYPRETFNRREYNTLPAIPAPFCADGTVCFRELMARWFRASVRPLLE